MSDIPADRHIVPSTPVSNVILGGVADTCVLSATGSPILEEMSVIIEVRVVCRGGSISGRSQTAKMLLGGRDREYMATVADWLRDKSRQ